MLASLGGISATWDIILFLCLSSILFFLGVSKGKNRIKFVILALYIDIVLFGVLPLNWIDKNFPVLSSPFAYTSVFVISTLILLYFLQNIFRIEDNRGRSSIKTLFLSFITAGFIMYILVSQISPATTTFSAIILKIFYQTNASWLWNIIPILSIILF
ncbi:MAG: hypothetical protein AAB795_02645 [Patescibacteria group bacterium]